MSNIAIIGSGILGETLAYRLATRDHFSEVMLIDPTDHGISGKTLDIQQSAAIEHFHSKITAHNHLDVVTKASVIVLAGPGNAPNTEWNFKSGIEILKKVFSINRRAIIICAGVTHRNLIESGVADLRIPRYQLIGSAPLAFQFALQAIIAVELKCSASQVSVAVLGRPPEQIVIPWTTATARGMPVSHLLDPPNFSRLKAKTPYIWPLGPYTLASATAALCTAVIRANELRGFSCFVSLKGELGVQGRVAAVTIELNSSGIIHVVEPLLSVQEQVQLDTALQKN